MSFLSDISFRRAVALFVLTIALLAAGTWTIVRTTTDYLINEYVQNIAHHWAQLVAENVNDLGQIAAGEQPSSASLMFFRATRKSNTVFRYIIFNRYGYSQLTVEPDKIAPVELSEFSAEAARAIAQGKAVVDIKRGARSGLPERYAEAYVPAVVNGKAVAVVGAYVNQAQAAQVIVNVSWASAIALCLLTGLAFAVPAVAWYLRTREKQQADRRIRFLAHHDVLTGLANRAQLIERLQNAVAVLPSTGTMIAVHFIDLDHFKQVNDTHGHDAGDFLLTTIGQRLKAMSRLEDTVARIGGDEFVVVQTAVVEQSQAENFARRIVEVVSPPTYFKEQEILPRMSVGIALAPKDGLTPERLLKSADLALYNAKVTGRGAIRFFSPEMDDALQARIRLERIIRHAIANDGFTLHYQPVFEMNGKKLIGFEALARLSGPDGEDIPPATFIPMAEEMRVIDKVGQWVLNEACRTAKSWPTHLTVAVNLSPAQFESGRIEEIVAGALGLSGLEPHRLELEITESLLLRNSEATLAALQRMKDTGVSIVMDDFGTGYSSLSYLWKFPFDKIKIDRSFMESFERSGHDVETVVKTIIALGRQMNMRVTVEGVETAEQVDFLYDAEADQVQGFFFGRPVSATEVNANLLKDFVANLPAEAEGKANRAKTALG